MIKLDSSRLLKTIQIAKDLDYNKMMDKIKLYSVNLGYKVECQQEQIKLSGSPSETAIIVYNSQHKNKYNSIVILKRKQGIHYYFYLYEGGNSSNAINLQKSKALKENASKLKKDIDTRLSNGDDIGLTLVGQLFSKSASKILKPGDKAMQEEVAYITTIRQVVENVIKDLSNEPEINGSNNVAKKVEEKASTIDIKTQKDTYINNRNSTNSNNIGTLDFKSKLKLNDICDFLRRKYESIDKPKNYGTFDQLVSEINMLFRNNYKNNEYIIRILYDLYLKYDDTLIIRYPFMCVYEIIKAKNNMYDIIFKSNEIEEVVFSTRSYIKAEKFAEEYISDLNDDFYDGKYDKYPTVLGKEHFILIFTDIIHLYSEMYCKLYDVIVREPKRKIYEAIECIRLYHTDCSFERFEEIRDWAESKIVENTETDFRNDLILELESMDLPKINDNNWLVDKTALALVLAYDEIMQAHGYTDTIFPTISLQLSARACKTIEEYIDNTKKELDIVKKLDLPENKKDVLRNVIVIYHYFFMYRFGLESQKILKDKSLEETKDFQNNIYDRTSNLALITNSASNIDNLTPNERLEMAQKMIDNIKNTEKEINNINSKIIDKKQEEINNNMLEHSIFEDTEKFVIEIEIPSVEKEELNIDYENGYIIVSVLDSKKEEESSIRKKYSGKKLKLYIGEVMEDEIEAKLKNGVLTLIALKKKNKKKITIN